MKVVLTGATGMVGKGLLLVCLETPEIEEVLSVSRSSTGVQHEKLREILRDDFMDLSDLEFEFRGYDACFFCLGVSAVGLNEKEYTRLTFDLTLHFARVFLKANPASQFCYISGTGTDSSEKGRIMWARVKGKTENALLSVGFKKAWMFRPGFIQPMRGIRSKTAWYQFFYTVLKPLYPVLRKFPAYVTDTDTLSRAMILTVQYGHERPVLESIDINKLGKA